MGRRAAIVAPIDHSCDEYIFEKEIEEYGFYLFLGRRRSGKSTYMRLVSQHLPTTFTAQHIVLAGNENIRAEWSQIVHPFWIHVVSQGEDDKGIDIIRKIIVEQNRRVKLCQVNNIPFPPQWEVMIWIDDCGTLHKLMHSDEIKWLSSNGRQIKASVFISIQKFSHACTELRENPDAIFVLNTQHEPTIKALRSETASMLPLKVFQSHLVGATRNRGMLVIRNHPKTPTAKDIFACTHCDFLHEDGYKGKLGRVGDLSHWIYAAERYKPEEQGLIKKISKPQAEPESESDSDEKTPEDEEGCHHFASDPFENGGITIHFQRKTSKPESNSSLNFRQNVK